MQKKQEKNNTNLTTVIVIMLIMVTQQKLPILWNRYLKDVETNALGNK